MTRCQAEWIGRYIHVFHHIQNLLCTSHNWTCMNMQRWTRYTPHSTRILSRNGLLWLSVLLVAEGLSVADVWGSDALDIFGYLWMFSCYVMLSLECMESSQSSHVLTGFCAGVVLRGAMHGHGCMGWRDAAFGGQGPGWEGFCSG